MIIEELRSRTGSLHKKIESNSILSQLLEENISLELYKYILGKIYLFIAPIEKKIEVVPGLNEFLPDYNSRFKKELLKKDLTQLDELILPETEFPHIFDIRSLEDVFGYFYVIEGSTLGGKIISRLLKENLNLSEDFGAGYYNCYGPARGKMWQLFVKSLEEFAQGSKDTNRIVLSAENTFNSLDQWISK